MRCETIHLRDYYGFLGKDGCNPTVEMFFPYDSNKLFGKQKKRPCLIVCPGGAYSFLAERESEPIALNFVQNGYNVFIIKYSVAPHTFPTQLCEVAALVELVYKNSDIWNCDTSKLAIIGFSAGGHLAAHYSTMFDCQQVRSYFPQSKSVNAAILCYPVITAEYEYAEKGSICNLSGKKPYTKEDIENLSCEKHVRETTPPTFIWHTAEDSLVKVMNSLIYAQALSENKVPYELHIYPYGPHGLSTADRVTNSNLPEKYKSVHTWIGFAKKWLELIGCAL